MNKRELQQKMNQATGKVPTFTSKGYAVIPPPDKDDPAPDIRELITDRKELNTLANLISQHREYGQAEKEAKKLKAPITASIKNILGKHEVARAVCDGVQINYYNVPRTSLKADLLREHGVSDEVIAASTVTTMTPTLRIGGGQDDD